MSSSFKQLDDLLRIGTTPQDRIAERLVNLPLRRFVLLIAALAAAYGVFMGLYALSIWWSSPAPDQAHRCWQIPASMVKLPAVFLLTLAVPLPSFYVLNAVMGCPLSFGTTVRLQVAAVAVNLAVVASLAPVLGFFTLNSSFYPFMVLINVFFLGIGGLACLAFMRHVIGRLAYPSPASDGASGAPDSQAEPLPTNVSASPLTDLARPDPPLAPIPAFSSGPATTVFRIWLLVYCVIGVQMSWVLRPFIGNPDMPFAWFRPRGGNFFQAVIQSIQQLLGMQ